MLVLLALAAGTSACGVRQANGDASTGPVGAQPQAGVGAPGEASPGISCRGEGSFFSLSLASDVGGSPTPEAAARRLAEHGEVTGVAPSTTGWQTQTRTSTEATVVAEGIELHVVRGRDGTWQVDSGRFCNR